MLASCPPPAAGRRSQHGSPPIGQSAGHCSLSQGLRPARTSLTLTSLDAALGRRIAVRAQGDNRIIRTFPTRLTPARRGASFGLRLEDTAFPIQSLPSATCSSRLPSPTAHANPSFRVAETLGPTLPTVATEQPSLSLYLSIAALQGKDFDGRNLTDNEARPRGESTGGAFGSGGHRSGFGTERRF